MSVEFRNLRTTWIPPVDVVWHSFYVSQEWTWVTHIHNVLSIKTILFDKLDFWCQLVVIRFVKTLSKRRMFVSFMKISACWLLHRLIKSNKICWEKRPAKPRPNLRTSFCRRDLKNTQPHLNFFRREKLSRRDYLDYLKNRAKSGDMAVLELTFRNVSLGKWSKNWSCYRRNETSKT